MIKPGENDFHDDYDDYDRKERYVEEKINNCICGAYQLTEKAELTLIADCCCGA